MRRRDANPTRSAHQRVLACKKEGQWQDALQIIAEMREQGVILGTVSYNAAIDACGKAKQVGRALELLDEIVLVGNQPDAVTYTALIDACGRAGLLDQAFGLFARSASALHASSRASRAPRAPPPTRAASPPLRRMQQARVEPNLITYNALIHACAQVCSSLQPCLQPCFVTSSCCHPR